MNTKKNEAFIFSQRLAGFLMMSGFVLLEIQKDKLGSGRNVFIFRDSTELHFRIENYLSGR